MRRQDLQLLNRARAGDFGARCDVGRRYLMGSEGFPQNVELAMSYLHGALQRGDIRAHTVMSECMSLRDLIAHDRLDSLKLAASQNLPRAQFMLGVWTLLTSESSDVSTRLIERAASGGCADAVSVMSILGDDIRDATLMVLRIATRAHPTDAHEVARRAVVVALPGESGAVLQRAMRCMIDCSATLTPGVADVVLQVVERARSLPYWPTTVEAVVFESCLEDCAARGSASAASILGLAYCGQDQGAVAAHAITTSRNLRKGAALLLRAADGGLTDAWDVLYRIHADNRSSVANPQMARFFLEKAATTGDAQAQRRLGALVLKTASSLHESEIALQWLHTAAQRDDIPAQNILRSLVLPVDGEDEIADTAIEAMMSEAPSIASRLRVARDFGLTRLEALCVDVMAGVRPWGLVVGENRYLAQVRLAQPRAVPSLSEKIHQRLRRSAAHFAQQRQDGGSPEGDLRTRSARLRRLLSSYGVEESIFFAKASSNKLDTLRHGPKWAFCARGLLQSAVSPQEPARS